MAKCAKGVHLNDLAAYVYKRWAATVKECQQLQDQGRLPPRHDLALHKSCSDIRALRGNTELLQGLVTLHVENSALKADKRAWFTISDPPCQTMYVSGLLSTGRTVFTAEEAEVCIGITI